MENRIESFMEKKVSTYPFSVNGMSVKNFKEFKKDAFENFNDSYANKIAYDHMYRMEMKPVHMLNDKVDLIWDNMMTKIFMLETKIQMLAEYIESNKKEEKEVKRLKHETFQRRTEQ